MTKEGCRGVDVTEENREGGGASGNGSRSFGEEKGFEADGVLRVQLAKNRTNRENH